MMEESVVSPITNVKVMAIASAGSSSIFEVRIFRIGSRPETKYVSTEDLKKLGVIEKANVKSSKRLEKWLNSDRGRAWVSTAKHNPLL
jgi:hypothetical protein